MKPKTFVTRLPATLAVVFLLTTGLVTAEAQVRRAPPSGGGGRGGGGGGGGAVTGRAVPRAVAPVPRPPVASAGRYYPYNSYYRPYPYYPYAHPGYYYPGFSVGLYGGYPYGFGYSVGFSYGYGYPGYGYPVYGSPWAAYPYVGFSYSSVAAPAAYSTYGSVRIEGAPRDAQVYADGYYAGVADDKVNLTPGVHRIEIRTPGAPPITFDVQVQPGQTITYRAALPPN